MVHPVTVWFSLVGRKWRSIDPLHLTMRALSGKFRISWWRLKRPPFIAAASMKGLRRTQGDSSTGSRNQQAFLCGSKHGSRYMVAKESRFKRIYWLLRWNSLHVDTFELHVNIKNWMILCLAKQHSTSVRPRSLGQGHFPVTDSSATLG